MDAATYLSALRRELDAFTGCLTGDLAAPVVHCGTWTLRDLIEHVGQGNEWAAVAVTERRGNYDPPPAPSEDAALAGWFAGTCQTLLDAVSGDPDAEAWTFAPPHTVGFWRRRRCMEMLVHRWDAEHALGAHDLGRATVLDPALADDGVAEVFDTMAPRQVRLGRAEAPEHAVAFGATDTGSTWSWGPGEPVATGRGTATDLLLLLWGRLPVDHPGITWDGDTDAARAALDRPLVP